MNRRLEEILKENERRIDRLTGQGRPSHSSRSEHPTKSGSVAPDGAIRRRQWLLREEPEGLASPGEDYFNPGGVLLAQIYKYIFHSSHVQTNSQWRELAGNTMADVDLANPKVNAFAQWDPNARRATIVLQGGCMAFSRLCGLAQAAQGGASLGEFCSAIGEILTEQRDCLTPDEARLYAKKLGLDAALQTPALAHRAEGIAAGVLAGIVAHELGHVVYGHIHSEGRQTDEASRSMERDADSFASAVISSSPWGEYSVVGMIVWNVALAWQEFRMGEDATTHPYAAERALDLLNANQPQAEQAGLDLELLMRALPGDED